MSEQVHSAPPGGWPIEPVNADRWADNMLKNWKVRQLMKKNLRVLHKIVSLITTFPRLYKTMGVRIYL